MSAYTGELVTTIKDRCKTCYTCVRHCPAKAIRIDDGQAEIIPERCIGCGNCVRVCTQKAKSVAESTTHVEALLQDKGPLAALIAPSFPAEFTEYEYTELVGALKSLGFDLVIEVAFGADVVAKRYKELYDSELPAGVIESSCPGVVAYIEKFHPALIKNLAPIVSPMIATARAVDLIHGKGYKKVFVGPCVAKKEEAAGFESENGVHAVLTFKELRSMFNKRGVTPEGVQPADFDEPRAALGRVYPLSHGFFQAAGIQENLLESDAISADGQTNFIEAIKEFEAGELDVRLLELLCCQGCIMGAGVGTSLPLYQRHAKVSSYARAGRESFNKELWAKHMDMCEKLDLSRTYKQDDKRMEAPTGEELSSILAGLGKRNPEDELNCGACGYETCVEHAIAIHKGLAEEAMCLPKTIERLRVTVGQLEDSNAKLADTREALMHSERLASMGQLAAGIAHEVNNPLGVILLYSHLLLEKFPEDEKVHKELKMIADQTGRCKKIVSGLLNFARQNKVARQPVDLVEHVESMVESFKVHPEVTIEVNSTLENRVVEIDGDQITQVLTNLITNGMDAMPQGGTIKVDLSERSETVVIKVTDTGIGIPEENMQKIFNPFFTTKKIGKGTGLGLAVSYGIVKMHSGQISAISNNDPEKGATGTTFTVSLPKMESQENQGIIGALT